MGGGEDVDRERERERDAIIVSHRYIIHPSSWNVCVRMFVRVHDMRAHVYV